MSSALESREHELKRCSAAAPTQPLAAHTARRTPHQTGPLWSAAHLSVARCSNSHVAHGCQQAPHVCAAAAAGQGLFVCLFVCLFAWVQVCREREENEALALKLKEMEKAVVVGGTDFSQDEELMLEWEQMIQACLRA